MRQEFQITDQLVPINQELKDTQNQLMTLKSFLKQEEDSRIKLKTELLESNLQTSNDQMTQQLTSLEALLEETQKLEFLETEITRKDNGISREISRINDSLHQKIVELENQRDSEF